MNKYEGKILTALLLIAAIFIGCMVNIESQQNTTIAVAFAAAPINASESLDSQPEAEIEVTVESEPVVTESEVAEPEIIPYEDFIAGVYDKFSRQSYEKLFEIYDYEAFMSRSEIPQYFQTMYTTPFASGTIRSSGCGITSLAMIATYLYDIPVYPDMLTLDYRKDNPASVLERIVTEDYLDIRMDKYYGMDAETELDKAMANGNPVILLYYAPSIFTNGGHFVVCAGMTEDGRYIINDPNLENLYRTEYVDEYMNGFTREQILYGLVGTYVFDNKADFDGDPARIPHR